MGKDQGTGWMLLILGLRVAVSVIVGLLVDCVFV